MSSVNEESVEILVELGLTHTEAKLYTTLLYLKSATARNIHRTSKVARQDVYQLLSDLQEKGLVEKIIGKPSKFRSIHPDEAVSVLAQRKNENCRQLKTRAIKHFKNYEIENTEISPTEGGQQFILLSKNETNITGKINKLGKAINNAQTIVMYSTTFQVFLKLKFRDEFIWKKAVERGVKLNFIVQGSPNKKAELAFDPMLAGAEGFEVRWTSNALPACMLLVDGKEVFYTIGRDINGSVLWSTNPNFVELGKDYFLMKWKTLDNPPF